jgi:hypothetical protein
MSSFTSNQPNPTLVRFPKVSFAYSEEAGQKTVLKSFNFFSLCVLEIGPKCGADEVPIAVWEHASISKNFSAKKSLPFLCGLCVEIKSGPASGEARQPDTL